jgi:hypothetical protein
VTLSEQRGRIVSAALESLECLTGEQVVAVLTIGDDERVTPWLWLVDADLRTRVLADLAETAWNASKSL